MIIFTFSLCLLLIMVLLLFLKIILEYYQKINLEDLFKKNNFNLTRTIKFPSKVARLNLLILTTSYRKIMNEES